MLPVADALGDFKAQAVCSEVFFEFLALAAANCFFRLAFVFCKDDMSAACCFWVFLAALSRHHQPPAAAAPTKRSTSRQSKTALRRDFLTGLSDLSGSSGLSARSSGCSSICSSCSS